jgi:membrane protease YdiL (CAAX protease family)
MDIKDQQKYFINTITPGFRVFIWLLILFFGIGLGQVASVGVLMGLGYDIQSLSSMDFTSDKSAVRLMAFSNQVFSFLIPSIFLGFVLFKEKWLAFTGLKLDPSFPNNKALSSKNLLIAGLIILCSWPLTQFLYLVNMEIPMPEALLSMENSTNGLIEQMLQIGSIPELIFVVLIMALTPAIGEELMFRGLFQRILNYNNLNVHLTVILSAIIFSTIHMQFQGFIPRFFLGLILGYFLAFGGSLWISIFAHFIFNGTQVVAAYVAKDQMDLAATPEWADFNFLIFAAGTLLFGLASYYFWNTNRSTINEI